MIKEIFALLVDIFGSVNGALLPCFKFAWFKCQLVFKKMTKRRPNSDQSLKSVPQVLCVSFQRLLVVFKYHLLIVVVEVERKGICIHQSASTFSKC